MWHGDERFVVKVKGTTAANRRLMCHDDVSAKVVVATVSYKPYAKEMAAAVSFF